MSKMVFVSSILKVPEEVKNEIKTVIFQYLWGGKRDKIKRSHVINETLEGGLNMIDVDSFLISLKAVWVPKLIAFEGKWTARFSLACARQKIPEHYIWKTTCRNIDKCQMLKNFPEFYQDVICAFNKAKHLKPLNRTSKYEIISEPLWGKELFKVNGHCMHFKNWMMAGVEYVKDLIDQEGNIMSDEDIYRIVGNKGNIMGQLYLVKKSIVKHLKHLDTSIAKYTKISLQPTILWQNKQILINNQKSKFFYTILKDRNKSNGHMESVYSRQFGFDNCRNVWRNVYKQKLTDIRIPKLREFNFKILNNIVPSGCLLHKWKSKISDKCEHCNSPENTEHMLFSCKRVKTLWNLISMSAGIQISWKVIVCGWPGYQNSEKLQCLNMIIVMISYGLFKINSKCKFDGLDYSTIDVNKVALETLLYYRSMSNFSFMSKMLIMFIERIIDILQ